MRYIQYDFDTYNIYIYIEYTYMTYDIYIYT